MKRRGRNEVGTPWSVIGDRICCIGRFIMKTYRSSFRGIAGREIIPENLLKLHSAVKTVPEKPAVFKKRETGIARI